MKTIAKLLLISLLLTITLPLARAQQLSDANELYDMYQFKEASEIYLRIIQRNQRGKEQATERLADCYRFMGSKTEAEKWYAVAVDYPDATNRINFNYGLVLRDLGKYAEAKEQFLKYAAQAPGDLRGNLYSSYMDQLMAWDKQKPAPKRHGNLAALNAGSVNSEFMDAAPVLLNGSSVVLASTRPTDPKKKRRVEEKMKLWQTTIDTASAAPTFSDPALLLPLTRASSSMVQGPASFTADGKTMFYTQSYTVNDGYGGVYEGLEIVYSTFDGKEWGKPEPFPYNSQEFNNAHPTISRDGKMLIYTSDMSGGYGATDMYMSRLNGTRWEKPRNMGPNVNTAEIEKYPVLVNDSVLYFSSNGHITLGGEDILKSVHRNGVWTKAENMRAPINSVDNDFCFMPLRGENLAMFASTRAGGKGDGDIYFLCIAPAAPMVLAGVVEVAGAIEKLNVLLANENGDSTAITPDSSGAYVVQVKDGLRYTVTAWADGFMPDSASLVIVDDNLHDTIVLRNLLLRPLAQPAVTTVAEAKKEEPKPAPAPVVEEKKAAPVSAEPVAAPVEVPVPTPTAEVQKEEAPQPAPVAEVKKEEPKPAPAPVVEEKKATPAPAEPVAAPVAVPAPAPTAEAQKEEAPQPAPAPVAEVKKEEPAPAPVAAQTSTVQRKFKNIYFDKNSLYPSKKSYGTIGSLLAYLKQNPNVNVHFEVFSDAQGTEEVNMEVSQRRAKILVAYMQQQGVAAKRITTAAYGDARPVNACKECSEAQYAENRRAEVSLHEGQGRSAAQPVADDGIAVETQTVSSADGKNVRQFRSISYAKNSLYPDKSSYANIGNLIAFMEDYPNAVVVLDVHSDAQGSESANKQVSDGRARVLSSYLQQNQVDESRIVLHSHGSSRPLNKCSAGVACTEKEHAVNRRVEVSVKY